MRSIPNLELVAKFLLSKGWNVSKRDSIYQYFSPPSELEFDNPSFQYALPLQDHHSDYQEYIYRIVASISDIYQVDKWYLFHLLSQSLDQLKEDIAMKQAILAA